MGDPIADLGLSCPDSSSFYICEDQPSRFLGCCTINPCTTAGGLCPDDDLKPLSFDSDAYDKILAQNCQDPGFLWWTCSGTSPPFLGCCSQDACASSSGCPRDKLGAASLSGNKQQAAPFLASSSSPTSTTPSTATGMATSVLPSNSSPTSTKLSTAASASSQPGAVSPPAHTGLSEGAIAGIAVGAVAGVCILALVALLALRQRRRRKSPSTVVVASSGRDDEYGKDSMAEYQDRTLHELMTKGQPSPGLDSTISELPTSPSTPGHRNIVAVSSADGVMGRDSELSGISAPAPNHQHSPLMHQSLFELEDSSTRT